MLNNNIGLYLHIPFCRKKCAYCNFYSAVLNRDVLDGYVDALINEIRSYSYIKRTVDTVYLGGGTPSVLGKEHITRIFSAIYSSFSVESDAEITVEANPEDVTAEFLSCLKESGVNRISLGAQSFNDGILRLVSRRHTAEDTKNAVSLIRSYGFDNLSVDIILGLPESNKDTLKADLETLIRLDADHISAYMLSLEPKTALYINKGGLNIPTEDETADSYVFACDFLKKAGYDHYEISNFAKNGKQSRHNNKYWLCEEYLGIGPSAYSYFEGKRFHYECGIKEFCKKPATVFDENGGDLYEFIMLALRLKKGVSFSSLKTKYSVKPSENFFKTASVFSGSGILNMDNTGFSLTEKGMLVSNTVISELIKEDNYEDI